MQLDLIVCIVNLGLIIACGFCEDVLGICKCGTSILLLYFWALLHGPFVLLLSIHVRYSRLTVILALTHFNLGLQEVSFFWDMDETDIGHLCLLG